MTPGIFQPFIPTIQTALATEMEKCNKIKSYTLFRVVWKKGDSRCPTRSHSRIDHLLYSSRVVESQKDGWFEEICPLKTFPGPLWRTPMTNFPTDLSSDIRGEPRTSSYLNTNQPCWTVRNLWSQCLLVICRAYCAWEQQDRLVPSWWMQFPGFPTSCSWTNWSPFRLGREDGIHQCLWPENLVAPAFLQVSSRELLFNSHGEVWACRTCHCCTLSVTDSCPSPSYRQLLLEEIFIWNVMSRSIFH